jgi:hypothetical protein
MTETVEQERTRYRRSYEGLRKALEREIAFLHTKGIKNRSLVHIKHAHALEEMLEEFDAQA